MSSDSSLRRVPSSGAAEIGYPKGHLGQLNEHETQALAEFKALLEEKGLYKPGPPPSHDDPTLMCVPRPQSCASALDQMHPSNLQVQSQTLDHMRADTVGGCR